MLTPKDLEKYHQAAERILNAMDNSPVPISWHEMDRMALQSVIAKELILIDKEARTVGIMLKKYALKMGVKPCPFCGGYPTIEGFSDNPGMYAISCGGIESNKQRIGDLTTECDLTSFAGKNIASVIEAWNKYCEETER